MNDEKTQVDVIEAKAIPATTIERKTKGIEKPWQVWCVNAHGNHYNTITFTTHEQAAAWAFGNCDATDCPVIVHIDIPPMEY